MNLKQHWKYKSLDAVAKINYGRSPAKILSPDGPYPVVGTGGADRKGDAFLYDGESVILGRKGTIDRVYFVTGKFWTIDTAYYLSNFEDVSPSWLYNFFQTLDLRGMNEATGVPSLSRSLLNKIPVPVPAFSEQSKIVEIIAIVDQAIEQTEALLAKQQRIKTGLMQDLLTRGIDEHGQLRTEQTHAFKDSPLGRIPMEWNVVPFSHFVEKLESGVSVNSDDQPCGAGQVGVLKTSAMYGGKFFPDQNKTVIHEDLQRVRVSPRKNTILISRMNTPNLVGESGFVDEDHPNLYLPDRIWMTKFLADKTFASKWMSFVLTSKSVRAFISLNATGTSGSMKNLPQKSLMGMLIASPTSESEIRQITKALIQSEVSNNSDVEHLRKLKLIKNALMQDLLTGRKRVTDLLEPVAA